MRTLLLSLSALGFGLLALGFIACATDGSNTNTNTDTTCTDTDVSFSKCVQPIFAKSCGGGFCHGSSNSAFGLVLTENAHANSVGVDSKQNTEQKLVVAGDPDQSYLLTKMKGTASSGTVMPPAGAIPAAEQALIETWIKEGAKNN
ncbi:MAG: hypothetical protein AAGJ35_09125 [Myxococcota bacterium]